MATSLMSSVNIPSILSSISTETSQNPEQMGTGYGLSKTSFLGGNTKKLFLSQSKRVLRLRKFKSLIAASSFNHIPKQFREENLKEGLMENYKNVPEHFYGLSPSQMNMFATKSSPIFRLSAKLEEESLSFARSYADSCGMGSTLGMKGGRQSTYGSMYGSRSREYEKTIGPPPDLPSLLLDSRIVFLGLPIVPAVAELINAQLIYLNFVDPDEPIQFFINCHGIKNGRRQIVSDCITAYSIADSMTLLFPENVYTLNLGVAFGQAAMLLSLGGKGKRFVFPNSSVKLYLPSIHRKNGQTTDIYIEAKDLQSNSDNFLKLLSEGIGKSAEVIRRDIRLCRLFNAQQAIDYGIADKVITREAWGFKIDESLEDERPRGLRFGGGKVRKPRKAKAAPSES